METGPDEVHTRDKLVVGERSAGASGCRVLPRTIMSRTIFAVNSTLALP